MSNDTNQGDRYCLWTLIILSCVFATPTIIVGVVYGVRQAANQTTMDTFQSLHSVTSCTMLNTSIVATTLRRGCTDIAGSNTLLCNTATSWVAALNPWNNNQSELLSGINLLNVNGLDIPDALVVYNATFPDKSIFQCYLTRPTWTSHTDCVVSWQEQPAPPLEQTFDLVLFLMTLFGVLASILACAALGTGLASNCR